MSWSEPAAVVESAKWRQEQLTQTNTRVKQRCEYASQNWTQNSAITLQEHSQSTFLLAIFTLRDDCNQVGIEILVQDTAILENNALRVDMLCDTMSHTHRMAQLKPTTSLIQHCDWDTCRGHYDPREWCLESEHALWYHVTHAQNGTAQANDITDTTLWLIYL